MNIINMTEACLTELEGIDCAFAKFDAVNNRAELFIQVAGRVFCFDAQTRPGSVRVKLDSSQPDFLALAAELELSDAALQKAIKDAVTNALGAEMAHQSYASAEFTTYREAKHYEDEPYFFIDGDFLVRTTSRDRRENRAILPTCYIGHSDRSLIEAAIQRGAELTLGEFYQRAVESHYPSYNNDVG